MATESDVLDLCGVRQVCSGLKAGLRDASCGCKNSLSRAAALWTVWMQWPRCARFLFNTYCGYAPLILHNHPTVIYCKGVSQGDPL